MSRVRNDFLPKDRMGLVEYSMNVSKAPIAGRIMSNPLAVVQKAPK